MQVHTGMAGEFRCVVQKADGSIKLDTGYQKNIILDQGLNTLGLDTGLASYCAIGTGNSQPNVFQTKLDNTIAIKSGTSFSYENSYNPEIDKIYYKTSQTFKYTFENLNNVNISEVGLCINTNLKSPNLTTRALIRDNNNNPTTITVLSGEILYIYYKLYQVFDLRDITGQINVLDGKGGRVPYNYIMRLAGVGGTNIGGSAAYGSIVAEPFRGSAGNNSPCVFSGELGNITSSPKNTIQIVFYVKGILDPYEPFSYKRVARWNMNIDQANGNIRSFLLLTTMGFYQIRLGSMDGDKPLTKTSQQKLSIPIEFSWGRYEGEL